MSQNHVYVCSYLSVCWQCEVKVADCTLWQAFCDFRFSEERYSPTWLLAHISDLQNTSIHTQHRMTKILTYNSSHISSLIKAVLVYIELSCLMGSAMLRSHDQPIIIFLNLSWKPPVTGHFCQWNKLFKADCEQSIFSAALVTLNVCDAAAFTPLRINIMSKTIVISASATHKNIYSHGQVHTTCRI